MAKNIKYRPLKAFLLAAECGSFTRAAQELGVTQPSFTALIQDLEATLDPRLFDRSTRSIVLTGAGIELRDRVQRPLADLEEAYSSMADLASAKRGTITMGALPSTGLTLIPLTLGLSRRNHPEVEVQVMEAHNDELMHMLRLNQIEFALATLVGPSTDLHLSPLLEDNFVAVFLPDHPVAKLPRLTWEDLVPHDMVLLSRGSSARSQFEKATSQLSGPLGRRFDVSSINTAILLVQQRLGLTVLPRLALPALQMDGLQWQSIEEETARRTIGILHREDRTLSPAGRKFIAAVKEILITYEQPKPTSVAAQSTASQKGDGV